ncbi:MAG: NAD-dependent epimerase/dehydratase family protein [Bacteroidota bacterium]
MKKILITGSSGLVGSEVCEHFASLGYKVHGLDNNQRAVFFGSSGDTRWNQKRLENSIKFFTHHELDIRDRDGILGLIKKIKPDVIVHAAAQPSHDKAADIPFDDFETNAVGTLNLLEAARKFCPESPFIFMSTNKVYGDAPNHILLKELKTRWDYADILFANGINETFSIDQSKHSLFGASKVAADIMVQEYGRYFNMPTVCLRGGCLTGPNHSGVELHGFLSYLVKCNIESKKYCIYGYKGKQVRDNIHAYDIVRFMEFFVSNPKNGEVYNLGGGKKNTCSILEAFEITERFTGIKQVYEYVEQNRIGDHICYYSDLSKMRAHFPQWDISIGINDTIEQIVNAWKSRRSVN